MKRLKDVKENIVNKAVQYKARLEVFFVTLLALFGTSTYAYADISGESIKNNVINNYLVPFCVVIICFLLIKEVLKKNVAGIVIQLTVGRFVLLIVSSPNIIKSFENKIYRLGNTRLGFPLPIGTVAYFIGAITYLVKNRKIDGKPAHKYFIRLMRYQFLKKYKIERFEIKEKVKTFVLKF